MEVTKEQIKKWKSEYGEDLFAIKIDGKICYLRKPTRKTLGYAQMASKNNPMKFNEVMLNDCWIAGDEEIRTDDDLFLGVSAKLADLIQIKEAELVKL